MNTTSLLVEILVVGIFAFFWLLLAFLAGGGGSAVSLLSAVLKADVFEKSAVVAFLSAFCYTLGIVVNRIADTILATSDARLRISFFSGTAPESLTRWRRARVEVITTNEAISAHLSQGRTLLRIARSGLVNFGLMGITLLLASWRLGWFASHRGVVFSGFVLCALFAFGSWFSWRRFAIADYDILRTAYQRARMASMPKEIDPVVSIHGTMEIEFSVQTVVFRIRGEMLEFLVLQRTAERGEFWQSVTGRVEDGESITIAASRETQEETGCRPANIWLLKHRHEFVQIRKLATDAVISVLNCEQSVGVQLASDAEVTLDAAEHLQFEWLPLKEASNRIRFDTNRQALNEVSQNYQVMQRGH